MPEVLDRISEDMLTGYATQWLAGYYYPALPPNAVNDAKIILSVGDWACVSNFLETGDVSAFEAMLLSGDLTETRRAVKNYGLRINDFTRPIALGIIGATWLKAGQKGPIISTESNTMVLVECIVNESMRSNWRRDFLQQAQRNIAKVRLMGADDDSAIKAAMYNSLFDLFSRSRMTQDHPTFFEFAGNGKLNGAQAHQLLIRALAGIALREL